MSKSIRFWHRASQTVSGLSFGTSLGGKKTTTKSLVGSIWDNLFNRWEKLKMMYCKIPFLENHNHANITKPKSPIIIIGGTTGVGKTKLSIELAKALNGEIINADSMQVYRGLDIATNKATKEEMDNVPHHLMSFLELKDRLTVTDYVALAVKKIDDIHKRGKIPIVVGGTNYYINALIDENALIESPNVEYDKDTKMIISTPSETIANSKYFKDVHDSFITFFETDNSKNVPGLNKEFEINSNNAEKVDANFQERFDLLKEIDPESADKIPLGDDRKVRRALSIWYITGKTRSEWFKSQVHNLRYDTCMFWIYSPVIQLDSRLDARVDDMIENGLEKELNDSWKILIDIENKKDKLNDNSNIAAGEDGVAYTLGAWQAIGFKEFNEYFKLKDTDSTDTSLTSLKEKCIDEMKRATRKYARRQITWLSNKLCLLIQEKKNIALSRLKSNLVLKDSDFSFTEMQVLDASDLTKWDDLVGQKGLEISMKFLEGKLVDSNTTVFYKHLIKNPKEKIIKKEDEFNIPEQCIGEDGSYICPVCRIQNGDPLSLRDKNHVKVHLSSKRHKRQLAKKSWRSQCTS